jgi:hypothetical protein
MAYSPPEFVLVGSCATSTTLAGRVASFQNVTRLPH